LGKGIRTGARDALLSDEARPETKAKVFGFHRAMDTFGAVLGPAFALLYLYYFPEDYKTLFFIAFVPGALAILSTFYLRDKKIVLKKTAVKSSFFSFLKYWKVSPPTYRKLVSGLLVFTLLNSSDVFLLLQTKQAGLSDTMMIGVYIFYNLIYALFSFPLGVLADKIGLKKVFVIGLALFSLVYFGMSMSSDLYVFIGLFFLYGIYAAATEGISKAWVTNISSTKDTATAIGTYTALQSLCAMLASAITGLIWFYWGAKTAFLIIAIGSLFVILYFLFMHSNESSEK
jgi:MFS family permease